MTRMLGTLALLAALAAGLIALPTAALAAPLADTPASVPDPPGSTVAAPISVLADVDDFAFESLDVDYTLGRTDAGASTLQVVETFTAVFPEIDQNRGMRRIIPDTYNGQPLKPSLVSITDGEGQPRPAETETEDGDYWMTSRADNYVHGRQVYVFTYTLENVTWRFPDTGEEFYWDVNGNDWRQPFGSITARVHLDADLAAALSGRQACYRGLYGSEQTCDIEVAGEGAQTVIEAEASNLAPRETVTLAIGFADGTFTLFDSSYLASPWGWLQGVAGLGVVGTVVWAVITRRRHLRDAPGRPTIIAEYTPPHQVDALESAVLLGRTSKASPAEVLEQAVVGSIRLVEGEKSFFGQAKLRAHLVDPIRADADGIMLLRGLFGHDLPAGAVFEFGRQDQRFSKAAQAILKAAAAELKVRGLRRVVPRKVRSGPILATVAAGILVVVTGIAAFAAHVTEVVPALVIAVAVASVFIVIGMMSRRPLTTEGADVRDHLKGLKEFIEWAEADRIRMLQSPTGAERVQIDVNDRGQMLKLYETLLPYAVVFGQEKEWAKHLAVLYGDDRPGWYYGSGHFNAAAFAATVGTLSSTASASSSTSGGSGGGGSAGGGGGGGGGGGV